MRDQFSNREKRLRSLIKEALLDEWDPIGIRDIPEAKDEYSGYVSPLRDLIIQHKSQQEIFDYLWWAETEHMGLSGNRQATESFSRRISRIANEI